MKTTEEWLALLPEPYQKNARDAIQKQYKGPSPCTQAESMAQMLMHAFSWCGTRPADQKFNWDALHNRYERDPDFVPEDAVKATESYDPDEELTVLEWFNRFPEPYRTKAINASRKTRPEDIPEKLVAGLERESNLRNCVDLGIDWFETAEGNAYWTRVNSGVGYSGLSFFAQPGVAEELRKLDKSETATERKSMKPNEADSGCDIATLRAIWPTCYDITHAVNTDRGHRYHHESFGKAPAIPPGASIEAMESFPNYAWGRSETYVPGMELKYLVRWLPGSTTTPTPSTPTPSTPNPTTTTAQKETADMKNGTYSVQFLLNKATAELKANKAALERHASTQAANLKYKEAIMKMLAPTPEGKDTPELAALRPIALPKSITDLAPAGSTAELRRQYFGVKFSYPRVSDNTQRLARAVASLSAMAEEKLSWNEDIDFILADFTIANGSTDINDSWSFEIPELRG